MCVRVATRRRRREGQVGFGAGWQTNFLLRPFFHPRPKLSSLSAQTRAGLQQHDSEPQPGQLPRGAIHPTRPRQPLPVSGEVQEDSRRHRRWYLLLVWHPCETKYRSCHLQFLNRVALGFSLVRRSVCAGQAATPRRCPQGPRPIRRLALSRLQIDRRILHLYFATQAVHRPCLALTHAQVYQDP